jgi:hypothetical protein
MKTFKQMFEDVGALPSHPHVSEWVNKHDNLHLGKDEDVVGKKLIKADVTHGHDRVPLHMYTRDSTNLNSALYRAHRDSQPHPEKVGLHTTSALDTAVNRNSLSHDLHLYSGVKFNPGHEAAKHPEGHVHLPAFTSTTLDKSEARWFSRADDAGHEHILHIHAHAGTKGKYVDHISENDGEKEFILPRNTTLKVHPTPTKYTNNSGNTTHVWHATVHNQ